MRILITGGTGFIGAALARSLMAEGRHTLRLMGRDFSRVAPLVEAGAEPVGADLRDLRAVEAACADMDAVFHIGALSAPWSRRPRDFHEVNVGGTEAVIAGCRKHGVRRLVYVSSPSVIFDGQGHENLPDSAPYPERFISIYSETKKLGEDRVNTAFTTGGLETIIIRPKAVFGPGDTTLLPRLIEAAQQGRLPQIGDGTNRLDLTYVDNVTHALRLSLTAERAVGGTYTITNGEPVLLWEVIRQVLRRLGISDRLRWVSVPGALTVASVMELVAAMTGKEPRLTRYSVLLLARTQTHDISAARCDLGYTPVVSVEEGLERTIECLTRPHPGSPEASRGEGGSSTDHGGHPLGGTTIPHPGGHPMITFHLLDTGYTQAKESQLIRGGRNIEVRCHALAALLHHPKHGWMLFDTGYAPRVYAASERMPYALYQRAVPFVAELEWSIAAQLPRYGLTTDDIGTIIVSHYHPDHIGGLKDFPNARFVASKLGWEDVRWRRGLWALAKGFLPDLVPVDYDERTTFIGLDQVVQSEPGFGRVYDLFGDGSLRLAMLLGHARGQMGLIAETNRGTVFFVADACYLTRSIYENRLPHPVTNLFTESGAFTAATLLLLHDFAKKRYDVRFIPTHCPDVYAREFGEEPG